MAIPFAPPPDRRILLGMLTPSSNTVLEPVCSDMLRDLPGVSAHFARFRVKTIALDAGALGQFSLAPMLEAAELLADAKVHSICWNGTSAAWMGLAADRALAEAIRERTGIPATSSVLALAESFRAQGVTRYGLVSPYTDDVQAQIIRNLASEGFECVAEQGLGIADNFSFSRADAPAIAGMVRAVAAARPEAITVLCTNLAGPPLVPALEEELGIPIHDSIATALWSSLRLAGVAPAALARWGWLFRTLG